MLHDRMEEEESGIPVEGGRGTQKEGHSENAGKFLRALLW